MPRLSVMTRSELRDLEDELEEICRRLGQGEAESDDERALVELEERLRKGIIANKAHERGWRILDGGI